MYVKDILNSSPEELTAGRDNFTELSLDESPTENSTPLLVENEGLLRIKRFRIGRRSHRIAMGVKVLDMKEIVPVR